MHRQVKIEVQPVLREVSIIVSRDTRQIVINLSDYNLPEDTVHLLELDGDSAFTPRNFPTKNNISRKERGMDAAGIVLLPFIPWLTDLDGKTAEKIRQLWSAKDRRDPLSSAGVYRIPYSYSSVYIGITKRSVLIRVRNLKYVAGWVTPTNLRSQNIPYCHKNTL
ncbi:hypothetical protein Trydic_g5527 [Trypoxylus dichotomus]